MQSFVLGSCMEHLFTTIAALIEQAGIIAYWLIFFVSFAESIPAFGLMVPGATLVTLAGFVSAQGYLDFGDLIVFAAIGAIAGDGFGYWLGRHGTRFFRHENTLLRLSHLERGQRFFDAHGGKSVLLARFVGPLRPIIPFVAGLSGMGVWRFLAWNVGSSIAWAIAYLSFGYLSGGALQFFESWQARTGAVILITFAALVLWWYLRTRRKNAT